MTMDTTDRIRNRLKNISTDVKRYLEKRFELFVITAGEHYSEVAAKLVQKGAGLFLLAIAFIFLLIALAEFVGALIKSQSLGYVIVSIPLIIVGVLLFKLKPQSFNKKVQIEMEENVIQLLDKYDEISEQELNTIEDREMLKQKGSNG